MKKFSALLIGLFALFSSGASFASSPKEVAKEFVEAMVEGDIDDVYDVVYLNEQDKQREKEVRAILTLASEKLKRQVEKLGGVEDIEADEIVYDKDKDDRGYVKIKWVMKNGTEKNDKIRVLKNHDNEWKAKFK